MEAEPAKMEAEPTQQEEEQLGFDLIHRLDQDFIFTLSLVDEPMKNLPEDKQAMAKKWLIKLGTETEWNDAGEKLKRNTYLVNLIECMTKQSFGGSPFNMHPPETLPPQMPFDYRCFVDTVPDWLDQMLRDESDKVHVGGKNFETYMATKLFKDGRGACAYLAVSVENEGSTNAWVKIRPNNRDKIIKETFEREFKSQK